MHSFGVYKCVNTYACFYIIECYYILNLKSSNQMIIHNKCVFIYVLKIKYIILLLNFLYICVYVCENV